jgi:hypothetical protein
MSLLMHDHKKNYSNQDKKEKSNKNLNKNDW